MKTISPNALVPQVIRKWKTLSHFRHTPMKCRVETRYLRESWKACCHCVDTLYGTWQVKRSKRNKLAEFSQKRCIHPFCRRMVRSAVDDTMTGSGGAGEPQILYRFGYAFYGGGVLREVTADVDQNIVILAPDPEPTGRQTDTLHCTLNDPHLIRLSH